MFINISNYPSSLCYDCFGYQRKQVILYTGQKNGSPQIFDINVFSIEDLLSELQGEYEADSQKMI